MPQNIFTGFDAEGYDRGSTEMYDPRVLGPAVQFLADIAQDGAVLEFGIGTGRVALPLAERGLKVAGIDISSDMLDQLYRKPGAEAIVTLVGDFATTTMPGTFALVYLVYNAISNLTTQAEQVACFRNAARHLAPGGRLVIELWIPDLRRFPPGLVAVPFTVSPAHLSFDEMDVATQQGVSHHYFMNGDHVTRFDSPYRYVWPSELDLMAQLAGLTLTERWADWDRSPFTSDSRKHISVWSRPREEVN
jgi:SAM-dependent methyltransferase